MSISKRQLGTLEAVVTQLLTIAGNVYRFLPILA